MFNRAILIGRLTAGPELKQTPGGVFLTNFQLAADRRYRDKDGERRADFITIVCWRQAAEFVCKYFRKGDPIGIEGSIQTRSYEDKQGNKRTAVEVAADSVFFVGGNKTQGRGRTGQGGRYNAPSADVEDFEEVEMDNDLPF